MDFNKRYDKTKEKIEASLLDYIDEIKFSRQKSLYESMAYSLEAGGKRFRPVLFFQTIECLGGRPDEYMDFACSLEYIHTYSLIHDDLPAMDDDDYRRGKKTNHKVFGEDIAILAGDGLLNSAFQILLDRLVFSTDKNIALAAQKIASCAGIDGMIAGQIVDLESEGKETDFETLEYIHEKKTAALIEASILSAALLLGVGQDYERALKDYAHYLGLAFQISDDILDCTGDFNLLGKSTGSDEKNEKTTYISLFGLEKSRDLLKESVEKAIAALNIFEEGDSEFLVQLADYVAKRNR